MEDYVEWVAGLERFFSECYELLRRIVTEANKQIDEALKDFSEWHGVKIVSGWAEPGIHQWLYEDIYSLGLGRRPFDAGQYLIKPVDSEAGLFGLWKPEAVLAVGTQAETLVYKDAHQSMVVAVAEYPQTKALLEIYRQCQERSGVLRSKLNIIEKRGDFKGTCDICRPWSSAKD
jgi:hypothetical protein